MSELMFIAYIEEAVAHFAKEYVIAGICAESEAVSLCRATYMKSLPQGVSTPDNYLYEIEEQWLRNTDHEIIRAKMHGVTHYILTLYFYATRRTSQASLPPMPAPAYSG